MRIRLTQCASGSRFDMQIVHAAEAYHTKGVALSKHELFEQLTDRLHNVKASKCVALRGPVL